MTNTIIEEVVSTFRLRKIKDDKEGESEKQAEQAQEVRNEMAMNDGREIHDLGENLVKCIRDYDVRTK